MNNNKSILILDTPHSCVICPLSYHSEIYNEYFCRGRDYYRTIDNYEWQGKQMCEENLRPSWCPLASLPLHKDLTRYIHRGCGKTMANGMMYVYDQGWNDCIDFILQNNKNT